MNYVTLCKTEYQNIVHIDIDIIVDLNVDKNKDPLIFIVHTFCILVTYFSWLFNV